MAINDYAALLRDPRWQRKRLEILERDGWQCQACGDKTKTLHVHHNWYRNGADPWDYDGSCLTTLCEDCHETITKHGELFRATLSRMHPCFMEEARGYIDACVSMMTGAPIGPIDPSSPMYTQGVSDFIHAPPEFVVLIADLIKKTQKPITFEILRHFGDKARADLKAQWAGIVPPDASEPGGGE